MKGAMATGLLVSRHLGACGFKRSVKTSRGITEGFQIGSYQTGNFRTKVTVRWSESLEETERRMVRIHSGLVSDLPAHESERLCLRFPDASEKLCLRAYADALECRWDVQIGESSVTVVQREQREEMIPQSVYLGVRRSVEDAGAQFMAGYPGSVRSGVAITREPGIVRIMVRPWIGWGPWEREVVDEANKVIMNAVHSKWDITQCYECLEGFVIKVRGSK